MKRICITSVMAFPQISEPLQCKTFFNRYLGNGRSNPKNSENEVHFHFKTQNSFSLSLSHNKSPCRICLRKEDYSLCLCLRCITLEMSHFTSTVMLALRLSGVLHRIGGMWLFGTTLKCSTLSPVASTTRLLSSSTMDLGRRWANLKLKREAIAIFLLS